MSKSPRGRPLRRHYACSDVYVRPVMFVRWRESEHISGDEDIIARMAGSLSLT